ncbi:MAG: glycoside hydrolase family 3 C-terminal domain-containing protein [Clostridia bacterium]|nr:glycoside hydrolase family 3 C-terminal domain-containing protein [Clostridia bacterium]
MDIKKLLSQMTIEEKIGQLLQCGPSIYRNFEEIRWDTLRSGEIGSFIRVRDPEMVNKLQRCAVEESRLGIPLVFADDIIHGYFTNFPVPAAEACSWEPELARRTAEVAAKEARVSGIQWTYAPMVDLARDARWGRNSEGAGEDPYLASVFAKARVEGFQGDDISSDTHVAACAKHFAGYSACMGGRDYNSVEMSCQTLYDMFLPPFKSAIDAGVATVMSAFHDFNGVPCAGNRWLLRDVLRDDLDFKGVLISDAGAVGQMQVHGYTEDERDTAKKAMDAGTDIEMATFTYNHHLKELVENGEIPMEMLDEAVERVLDLKNRLGLFENPYIDVEKANSIGATEQSIALARECSRKSIVLLKNDNKTLPLNRKSKIAVIGALAGNEDDMHDVWSGKNKNATTIYGALKANNYDAMYAKGYDLKTDEVFIEDANRVANECDVILFVAGEGVNYQGFMSGEARNRSDIEIPKLQQKLLKELKRTGKPIVAYIFSGRPLALRNVDETVDAILWSGGLGTEAGNAVMDVLFGDYNPSAKLVWTFPTSNGQSPYFYNHNNTGKPPIAEIWYSSKYIDAPIGAQYPFGYGLSYTSFKYDNLQISSKEFSIDDVLEASVEVTNTGDCFGEEIVELYVRDLVGSMVRPVRELKGFDKIGLNPGEKKTVVIKVPIKNLGFHNQKMEYVVEPGKFMLYVGPDSASGLETEFFVK